MHNQLLRFLPYQRPQTPTEIMVIKFKGLYYKLQNKSRNNATQAVQECRTIGACAQPTTIIQIKVQNIFPEKHDAGDTGEPKALAILCWSPQLIKWSRSPALRYFSHSLFMTLPTH